MRRALLAAAEAVVLGLGVSWGMGQVSFVTLDPPGSDFSPSQTVPYGSLVDAYGISGDNVVGEYLNSSGVTQGFLWNGSSYTILSDPLASASGTTVAEYGISGGNVIGTYTDSSGDVQSFIWSGSTYTTISFPGAVNTYANGIAGGIVVGSYSDPTGNYHGFIWNGSTYTSVNAPGVPQTGLGAISGGEISGGFTDSSGVNHSFALDGSTYTVLNAPGASVTYSAHVSRGEFSGLFADDRNYLHGYVFNGQTYTVIDDPLAAGSPPPPYSLPLVGTILQDFNYGNAVGSYTDANYNDHGFVWNGSAYTTLDVLGAEGTVIFAIDGTTVGGRYIDSSGLSHAFIALNAATPQITTSTWTNPVNGSWSDPASWSSAIPQIQGDIASFLGSATASTTITLDANQTVASLTFNNANSYTIAPGNGGSLTLDNGSDIATITDLGGTHTIAAPIYLNSDATITVANAGDAINLAGNISGFADLAIAGAGTVVLSGTNNAINALTINTGSTLDITNTRLLIHYGSMPDPLVTIQSYLAGGYNNGTWTGVGLISSSAASSSGKFAIGYLDGTDPGGTPGQLLIQYALIGDTNLDGIVNLTDLLTLLNNYGQSGMDWADGDFNYDGTVNLTDLLALLNNYGSTTIPAAVSTQVVPEPVQGCLLTLGILGLLTRRSTRR